MRWSIALLLLVPAVLGHGGHGHDESLLAGGERLMMGDFQGTQAGPLVVVPHVDGPMPCTAAWAGYLLPAGPAAVAVLSNTTHIRVMLRVPDGSFAAAGLDSSDAVRSLLLMQEHAVALHPMTAAVATPGDLQLRSGILGIPYLQPGGDRSHAAHFEGIESDRALLAYGNSTSAWCRGSDQTIGMDFLRNATDAWRPGRIVHAAFLVDEEVAAFLPRPLDSTEMIQYNLYLSRPGEDPQALRSAFEPSPGAQDTAGLLAVGGVGALAVVAAVRRR